MLPEPLPAAAPVHQRRQRRSRRSWACCAPRAAWVGCATSCTCTATARRTRDLPRAAARAWRARTAAIGCTSGSRRARGGSRRRSSATCAPTGASARPSCAGRPRCSSTLGAHWRASADPERLHLERFQPEGAVGGGERGCGGTIEFCASAIRASSDGAQPILVAGESAGGSCRTAAAWASATAASGACAPAACATCAQGACTVNRRPASHLHQRARGRDRDRALEPAQRPIRGAMCQHPARRPPKASRRPPSGRPRSSAPSERRRAADPLAHLSAEQLDQLGREFDAIHAEVFAELGERDARYIRGQIRAAPPARAGRAHPAADRLAPAQHLCSSARRRYRSPRCSRTWRSATT